MITFCRINFETENSRRTPDRRHPVNHDPNLSDIKDRFTALRVAGSQRKSRCCRLTGYLPTASDRPRLALHILDDIEPSTAHTPVYKCC
jgi:hypothetical protein